jgi:PAS domain S-box-containing protein
MQRKQAELALAASQRLLRSVITSAPVILYSLDCDGVFTLSEGRALEGLGLSSGQVVGQSALEMYADLPDLVAELKRALAGESFNSTAEVRGRSYQTWFSPIIGDSGEVTGTVGVAIDVTEQRLLEEQLQQSQKLESIGRLAGGIAHDFNNMLTAIIGYSELVMEHLPSTGEAGEEMLEIRRAADRASLLTNQLLAFSRKQILRPKTLDLNEVVTDVSRMLQRLIGEDVTMVTRLGEPLGPVNADPGQLTQVLMNLAVNARDAMPDGGILTLETSNVELDDYYASTHVGVIPGPYVMLAVSDTGTGMASDVQRRIFEPFFTTKPVGKGTGMGLASVYGIVKQSGGNVWVYSELGHGSTFKVYLPRAIAPDRPARETAGAAALPRGSETILLVEDEQMVRELVRRSLEGCGYSVIEAADGPAALEMCRQIATRVDLLITDVVMPRMNGRQLATEITAARPDIRVLFMSGYTDNAIVHHGVLDETTNFLQKPFAMRTLVTKVREILDS